MKQGAAKAAPCFIGLFLLLWAPLGYAQSLGVGLGVGAPLTTYVEDEMDLEFRVSPEPGYYPVLRERTNQAGTQFHISLLLDTPAFNFFDDIEIRFDYGTYGWDKAIATHTGCSPVVASGDVFDDAAVEYFAIEEASCLDESYDPTSDITALELAVLQVYGLGVVGRWQFIDQADWLLWGGLGAGLGMASFDEVGAELYPGLEVLGSFGVGYRLSDFVSVELELRLMWMMTEAPDTLQNRINHDAQTSGNIFTSLIESLTILDLQLGIRFGLSDN